MRLEGEKNTNNKKDSRLFLSRQSEPRSVYDETGKLSTPVEELKAHVKTTT